MPIVRFNDKNNKPSHGQNNKVLLNLYKKKILIDLDGVLNEYGKELYDESYIPNIKAGAKEFIKELSELGELYLFTSRNLISSIKWLINNNMVHLIVLYSLYLS